MKRHPFAAITLAAALAVITGCAPSGDRSAGSFEETTDSTMVGASCSSREFFGLRSELKNWWDGSSLPVTWEVTWTENKYWEGASRADHAPPEGFQGLTQNAGESTYTPRLEISAPCNNFDSQGGWGADTLFRMRPVVTIDGQRIPLAEIPFHHAHLSGWFNPQIQPFKTANGGTQPFGCGEPYVWSEKTPRGRLYYEFLFECNDPPTGVNMSGPPWPTFVIRNYSR